MSHRGTCRVWKPIATRPQSTCAAFSGEYPVQTRWVSDHSLHFASDYDKFHLVARNRTAKARSGCPVSVSLEVFGDRWSLLIVRDLMVRGYKTFREFQEAGEGIATNILADRLKKLEAAGVLTSESDATDRRKIIYRLTEKGIDLAPALLELLLWAARHEKTAAPCKLLERMGMTREAILAETRRRR